jgi:hypothetical protein
LKSKTYLRPAIPSTTRLSLVSVPVLSKQQISTLPANGIRNGSVQNTPGRQNLFIYKVLNVQNKNTSKKYQVPYNLLNQIIQC